MVVEHSCWPPTSMLPLHISRVANTKTVRVVMMVVGYLITRSTIISTIVVPVVSVVPVASVIVVPSVIVTVVGGVIVVAISPVIVVVVAVVVVTVVIVSSIQ